MTLIDSLTRGTPLSNRLLIAAWDDLSVETKAEIITKNESDALSSKEVQRKILADKSAFIRYLVVTVDYLIKICLKIKSKPTPLT